MNENTLLTKLTTCVALAVVSVVAIVHTSQYYDNKAIVELVSKGVDPVVARCIIAANSLKCADLYKFDDAPTQ